MKSPKIYFSAALLALATACNSVPDNQNLVGKDFEAEFSLGEPLQTMPLPEGKWELVSQEAGGDVTSSVLIQHDGKRLTRLIQVSVPTSWKGGKPRNIRKDFCSRDDLLHQGSKDLSGPVKDCFVINHWSMNWKDETDPLWNDFKRNLTARNIDIPLNVLVLVYHQKSYLKEATVAVAFNPEQEGFPAPRYEQWGHSEWHKSKIYQDQDRLDYVDKLKNWGENWRIQLKEKLNY